MANNTYLIDGVPNTVTFATYEEFAAAYTAARGGTVLIQTALFTPQLITLSQQKVAPGITIVFREDQVLALTVSGMKLNTEVFGGHYSYELLRGALSSSSEYSVKAQNASHFALRGARVGPGITLVSIGGCEDMEFSNLCLQYGRNDPIKLSASRRIIIEGIDASEEAVCYAAAMTVYDSLTTPPERGSAAQRTMTNCFYLDIAHADACQFDYGCEDIIFRNNRFAGPMNGLVNFGEPAAGETWTSRRVRIENNYMLIGLSSAVEVYGNDFEIVGNQIGNFLDDPATSSPTIKVRPADVRQMRGGRNTVIANQAAPVAIVGTVTTATGTVIDMASSTVNGDVVVAPEPPRLRRASFAPLKPATPPPIPWTGPPLFVIPPEAQYVGQAISETYTMLARNAPRVLPMAAPKQGEVATATFGFAHGCAGASFEWRWRWGDGTVIEPSSGLVSYLDKAAFYGARSRRHQFTAADVGRECIPEIRAVHPTRGDSGWVVGQAVIPVAA